MPDDREAKFRQMVSEFPDSPMGHFSLGKLLLDQKRYAEAAQSLSEAARLDPNYAAALVSLGDAYAHAGKTEDARNAYLRAKQTPHGQKDIHLIEDVDARLAELG